MLEALRDGRVGRIDFYSMTNGGQFSTHLRLDIVAGRRAFGDSRIQMDYSAKTTTFAAMPLKPAAVFAECLAQGPASYEQCLADPLAMCP